MTITSRHAAATLAVLATTTLSVLTVPPSQGAAPITDPLRPATHHPSPESTPDTPTHQRPCFTWRSNWNDALDAPQPTCPPTPGH